MLRQKYKNVFQCSYFVMNKAALSISINLARLLARKVAAILPKRFAVLDGLIPALQFHSVRQFTGFSCSLLQPLTFFYA